MTKRPALMKPAEVAAELGVKVGTLAKWRTQGVGPRFLKLGPGPKADVRYEQDEVAAYKAARTKSSTSDVTEDRAASATH